jgi:hypothetical protein
MIEVVVVYLALAITIAYIAFNEDKVLKGYNPKAKDGDKDGTLQDGTRWERKAKK